MGAGQLVGEPCRVLGRAQSGKQFCFSTRRALHEADNTQGGEKYQQAFYVYEELAQAPSTASIRSLVSQAVCELHLGRLEEAQAALEEALKKDPQYIEAIANMLVLTTISGADASEYTT